jgi:hypothetical protein
LAEVYWDREWSLQQLGFDYCYDKRLYDRLLHGTPESLRQHLQGDVAYQRKLVRFLENHDEIRALTALGPDRLRAAALLALTLPGAVLLYHGQLTGVRAQAPIHLGRAPDEPRVPVLREFYQRVLAFPPAKVAARGDWNLCLTAPLETGGRNFLLAHHWRLAGRRWLVVVNYGPEPMRGHVFEPGVEHQGTTWTYKDLLTGQSYTYADADVETDGLYVELPPWGGHLFEVAPAG